MENAVNRSCIAHKALSEHNTWMILSQPKIADFGLGKLLMSNGTLSFARITHHEASAQHQGSICKATYLSVFPSKEIIGTEMDNSEISAVVCFSIYIRT